jgi:hypothetical protein
MASIDLKNATLTIQDGTPNTTTVVFGEDGNLTWSERITREYRRNAGVLNTVRDGDEEPVEVSVDSEWEYIVSDSGASTPTPYEAFYQLGPASTWITSDTVDECGPYAVNLIFVNNPACNPTGITNEIETVTFPNFRVEQIDFDADAATMRFNGKCNVTKPTIVRST